MCDVLVGVSAYLICARFLIGGHNVNNERDSLEYDNRNKGR